MLSRRALLMGIGAAPLTASPAHITLGCQTNAWPVDPQQFDSLVSVLGKIRELGFAGFETGYRNVQLQAGDPRVAQQRIQSTGLQFFGVHIFLLEYDGQSHIAPAQLYQKVAETGAALGAQRLILSGAAASTEAELARKAVALDGAGTFARTLGLQLAYHNHDKEFGNSGWEIRELLRRTNPELTNLLLDAGHAFQGGADVPAFLEEAHRRIIGVHLRDYRDGRQVPLGSGDFPLPQVAATLKRIGWQGWVLAEEEREDGSKPAERAVEPAMAALRKYFA